MLQYTKKNITAKTGTIMFSIKKGHYLAGVKSFYKLIIPNFFAISKISGVMSLPNIFFWFWKNMLNLLDKY